MKAKKFVLGVGLVAAIMGLGGGVAYGVGGQSDDVAPQVATFRAGSISSKQYLASQTDAFSFSAPNVWVTIPTTTITVTVPAGTTRVIMARFSAESLCTNASWCSMRIVYRPYTTGVITEMSPASGTDFAWDSPGGSWENAMIERSTATYLPAGSYHVFVQGQLVGGSSGSMRTDDYHLAVEAMNP